MRATAKPQLYTPRHPERTLLYQTVVEHCETCNAEKFIQKSP